MKHVPGHWMRAALHQAVKAGREGEPPIGAVIVYEGQIIGRGRNQRETRQDVTLHAEMIAIRQACRHLGSWRLEECTLFVTLEPCIMCAGAILQARISQVFYGAPDPKAGACGSVINIFALHQNHQVKVRSGLMADVCSGILKVFFQERRIIDKAEGSRAVRKAAAIRRIAARIPPDAAETKEQPAEWLAEQPHVD